jgi:predicted P-loop ATPase
MPPTDGPENTQPSAAGANGHSRGAPRDVSDEGRNGDEIWERQLLITDDGFAPSVGNVELILSNHPAWRAQLRYDARSNVVVLEPGAPISEADAARTYKDSDDARTAIWFGRSRYKIAISPASAALAGAVSVVAERNTFDPVRDWLDTLEWDDTPRLPQFASVYLGAENTPIHSAYALCWLISAVARVYEPGCQADHMLTLVGPQGGNKSTFYRTLAVRPEWFTDSLPSLSDRKAAAEILHGKWIVEHAELDQLGRAQLSTAKAWLTARADDYRAAYAKRANSHPRRCVFGASTNEDAFLRDATGTRRFWPVTVGAINLGALERDLTQLWAEAVHRFRAGEQWHLTDPALIDAARDTQEGRYQLDAWELLVERWLKLEAIEATSLARRTSADPEPVRVTLAQALEGAISLKPDRWDQVAQNRVARCLQHLGWERRQRRDGDEELGPDGKPNGQLQRRWAYERREHA